MKRRLTKAYDCMTMPDSCSRRIEAKLQERIEQKKIGNYSRTVAPTPSRRSGWTVAVAAVCLVLVLSVSGTILFLNESKVMLDRPEEAVITVAPDRMATAATPEDHYAMVTEHSAEEVEAFAASVRQNVLDGDWEEFAKKVNYPLPVYDKQIGNDGGLVGLTIRNKVKDAFIERIKNESCRQMFCNWQGICMADGRIWINEVEGQLKITAINDMFGPLADPADFHYTTKDDGNYALLLYDGMAEEITVPSAYGQKVITQVGAGTGVIRSGDAVKIIRIPETVTAIRENAFANCPDLRSVFFLGDAPPEAEGVFEGSENVTVYYKPDSKGWGDTWCGRPTMQYDEGYISLGTVRMHMDPEVAYQALANVLKEKQEFYCHGYESLVTITEYCEKRSETVGAEVTIPLFTMVDMDLDGIKELILRVSIEGDMLEDYLILRCAQNTGDGSGFVYTYMEPQQKMTDLKKDGSFCWRESGPGQGESRLVLNRESGNPMVVSNLGDSAGDVLWHAWPCVRPEAVLQSYEYAGTGESRFPGNAWYTFEGIASGTMDNNWAFWKGELTRWGMICLEAEGEVLVCDPDAPGCRMFGTLDEKGRFTSIGYYISNEYGEREAEVRNLLEEIPEYVIGSHLEELDSHGRIAGKLDELTAYLS